MGHILGGHIPRIRYVICYVTASVSRDFMHFSKPDFACLVASYVGSFAAFQRAAVPFHAHMQGTREVLETITSTSSMWRLTISLLTVNPLLAKSRRRVATCRRLPSLLWRRLEELRVGERLLCRSRAPDPSAAYYHKQTGPDSCDRSISSSSGRR